jgi:hypothetical protein
MKCSPEDVAGGKYTRLVITPPPGQHPHPLRTDQVVYESYDQEKGIPGIPRLIPGVQEREVKPSPPDASCQDEVAEMDAIQRWLDDGGSLEKESSEDTYRANNSVDHLKEDTHVAAVTYHRCRDNPASA